jgi:hypothetical protein
MTIPIGAACYFCLGEEVVEKGKPLVRNCSCRGDSAGFAHLSCLTKYAEQKCKQAVEGDMSAFSNPWQMCNNCKQPFQGQLAIDLASAFISFAEATYSHEGNSKLDKMKVMFALRFKISAIFRASKDKHDQILQPVITLSDNLLAMVDQTKKDLNMSGWIHMPKDSEEYEKHKVLCGNYEAFAHLHLGRITKSLDMTEKKNQIALGHMKKVRAISNLVGMKDNANQMDMKISTYTNLNQEDPNINSSLATSPMMQNLYEQSLNINGLNSEITLQTGLHYAILLWNMNHCIEAERRVTNVPTISRRVLGPRRTVTIEADELLKKCRERIVTVLPQNKLFQVLRYENDGEMCVVTGPVAMPRNLEDERVYHVDSHLVIPNKGCPVLCHGLVSASHLNGELGEVRNWKQSETGIRLGVYFEEKGVKSVLVKPENLHIACSCACYTCFRVKFILLQASSLYPPNGKFTIEVKPQLCFSCLVSPYLCNWKKIKDTSFILIIF